MVEIWCKFFNLHLVSTDPDSLNFLHVRREANQIAHYLGKYALHNLDCIWMEETPPYISAHLIYCQTSQFTYSILTVF